MDSRITTILDALQQSAYFHLHNVSAWRINRVE